MMASYGSGHVIRESSVREYSRGVLCGREDVNLVQCATVAVDADLYVLWYRFNVNLFRSCCAAEVIFVSWWLFPMVACIE